MHYTYITKIKKEKITETDEKYSDTFGPIIDYTPIFDNTIRYGNRLTHTNEDAFVLVNSSTDETHSNDKFIEDNSTNNDNSYSGSGNGYYDYGYRDWYSSNQGYGNYNGTGTDYNGAKPGTGNEQGLLIDDGAKDRVEHIRNDTTI